MKKKKERRGEEGDERKHCSKRGREDDPHGRERRQKQPKIESSSNEKAKYLPDGWLDCPFSGEPLFNLIPSKAPLGEKFNDCIPHGKRYSPKQVVQKQRVSGRKIGMVVDLTNTTRYHDSSEWKSCGIKHLKIACRGRHEVPDGKSVNIFVYEVSRFLHHAKQKGDKIHVLVHCTHGYNRTGFMIVSYLVRVHGMTVADAVGRFAVAREPGIYKPDYIQKLFELYNENKPDSIICPPVPEWKSSGADDEEEEINAIGHDHREDEEGGKRDITNDDVLGEEIPWSQQREMQRICCNALGVEPRDSNPHFPGSQPVSVNKSNMLLLRQRYYYATWKADGTRYMMLITREGSFLIDRRFSFRRVELRFPKREAAEGCFQSHDLTLLDGEMVIDTDPGTGKKTRRYLVYDLMMVNHESKVNIPFRDRWKLIEREVIQPRTHDMRTNKIYCYDKELFRVRRKNFWMLSALQKLVEDLIPGLPHQADGLIFQGWDDRYVPHAHEGLLKWKYAHMNSVDLLFEEEGDGDGQSLYVTQKGRKRKLEGARVRFNGGEDPSRLCGKIIECCWNWKDKCWEFMRVRPDKPTPNGWYTYLKVMSSIEDDISQDTVLKEVADIVCLPMYVERSKQEMQAAKSRT